MKKIWFLLFCFFSMVKITWARELVSEPSPYYINIGIAPTLKKIINVPKIYDKETGEAVFSLSFNSKNNSSGDFQVLDKFDAKTWGKSENVLNDFNTLVYYFYQNNQDDYHYFLTQIGVWSIAGLTYLDFVDEFGNKISSYKTDYETLKSNYNSHRIKESFFNSVNSGELGVSSKFYYYNGKFLFDIEEVPGIKIENKPPTGTGANWKYPYIEVNYEDVGDYEVRMYKDFEQISRCYTDGTNIFWQSLGGPASIEYFFRAHVTGTEFLLQENLIGVNNRYGDAYLNSNYEMYLDKELKFSTVADEIHYVKKNSEYTLKDVSTNEGVIKNQDVVVSIRDTDKKIVIDKYVVSKKIDIAVLDDLDYGIYLKRTDELYEILNKDVKEIILPYGVYYIKNVKNDFYQELEVKDNERLNLILESEIAQEEMPPKEDVEVENKPEDNLLEVEDVVKNESVNDYSLDNEGKITTENPQTKDDIEYYFFIFLLASIILIGLEKSLQRNVK